MKPSYPNRSLAHLGYARGAFPEAERAADQLLSLPLYPEITPAQQERVAQVLRDAV